MSSNNVEAAAVRSETPEQDTFEQMAELIRKTLALREAEPIEPKQLFFYDLGFTSMDLLDLLFRIEQHFQISIPEGTIYHLARGEMPETEFAVDGVLSEPGPDVPPRPCRLPAAGSPRITTNPEGPHG